MIQFLWHDFKELWDKKVLAVWKFGGSTASRVQNSLYIHVWTLQSPIYNRLLVVDYVTKSHGSYLCYIYILPRDIFCS